MRKRVEKVSSIERIKSNVDKEIGDSIRSYQYPGVKVDEDFKRYYPFDELASKVLGFTGSDLKDLEELLEQTVGKGVDVYTHSEMLPGQYYPAFKKYPHFAGNYGNAWWKQTDEFEKFNGVMIEHVGPAKGGYWKFLK